MDTGGSYEYSTLLVLRDVETAGLFTAADSGCSCPSPFDGQGHGSAEGPLTFHEVAERVQAHARDGYYDEDDREGDVDGHLARGVELVERLRGLNV